MSLQLNGPTEGESKPLSATKINQSDLTVFMLLPPYTVSVSDGTELTDPATNFL